MNFLGGIWKWIALAGAAAAGVLAFLLKLSRANEKAAKMRAAREKANRKAVESVRAKERRMDAKRAEARSEANALEEKIEADRQKGRRDQWADPRLRETDDNGGES